MQAKFFLLFAALLVAVVSSRPVDQAGELAVKAPVIAKGDSVPTLVKRAPPENCGYITTVQSRKIRLNDAQAAFKDYLVNQENIGIRHVDQAFHQHIASNTAHDLYEVGQTARLLQSQRGTHAVGGC